MPTRICSKCWAETPLSAFGTWSRNTKTGRKGDPSAKSAVCTAVEQTTRKQKAMGKGDGSDEVENEDEGDVEEVLLDEFLVDLDDVAHRQINLKVQVDPGQRSALSLPVEIRVDQMKNVIEHRTGLKWTCVTNSSK